MLSHCPRSQRLMIIHWVSLQLLSLLLLSLHWPQQLFLLWGRVHLGPVWCGRGFKAAPRCYWAAEVSVTAAAHAFAFKSGCNGYRRDSTCGSRDEQLILPQWIKAITTMVTAESWFLSPRAAPWRVSGAAADKGNEWSADSEGAFDFSTVWTCWSSVWQRGHWALSQLPAAPCSALTDAQLCYCQVF